MGSCIPHHTPDSGTEDRIHICLEHAQGLIKTKSETVAMKEMRGLASWYLKGLPCAKAFKNQCSSLETYDDLVKILQEYKNRLKEVEGC